MISEIKNPNSLQLYFKGACQATVQELEGLAQNYIAHQIAANTDLNVINADIWLTIYLSPTEVEL